MRQTMKKAYEAPVIHVITYDIESPILNTSPGSKTISDEEPDYGDDSPSSSFIGFGEGTCEDPE